MQEGKPAKIVPQPSCNILESTVCSFWNPKVVLLRFEYLYLYLYGSYAYTGLSYEGVSKNSGPLVYIPQILCDPSNCRSSPIKTPNL